MNATTDTMTRSNLPMILRATGSTNWVRVNRSFEEELGLTRDDLGNVSFLDWIHSEDRQGVEALMGAGTGHVEGRHRDEKGEWVAFGWTARTHAGEVVLLGLASEAAETTQELDATRNLGRGSAMSETLDAMARVVESKNPGMRCSILLLDEKKEYVASGAGPSLPAEYNAAIAGLRIGPTVGSCGTAAYWNVPVVVEDIANDCLWTDLLGAAAIAGVAACWSHPITAKSGEVLGAMALYNDKPRAPSHYQMDGLEIAARMVGLAVERDRLEEQLRQAAKMEALGVLAGGIAHDFNNLLAAILGNAELASTLVEEHSEMSEMLGEIVRASTNATELCSQMLAYAGRGSLAAESLDCNELVTEIGGLLKVALSKKAELVFELSSQPAGVIADRSQLRQVVMNLITNASEAIGNETGTIVISSAARYYSREELDKRHPKSNLPQGPYVRLSIRDTGRGMKATTRTRIFDPFFTTKPSGRGLGLAAVQGIVRRHGGAIGLDSEPGNGTTFVVLLPHQDLPGSSTAGELAEPQALEGKCVLVVDDEDQVRHVVAKMLRRGGYRVITARDGQQALDLFRDKSDIIDCVLLDLSMPKLNGEEVFRELRRMQSNVRVVLSSGYTEQQVVERFTTAGLAGVIQKPMLMKDLLAAVASAIRSHEAVSPPPVVDAGA